MNRGGHIKQTDTSNVYVIFNVLWRVISQTIARVLSDLNFNTTIYNVFLQPLKDGFYLSQTFMRKRQMI